MSVHELAGECPICGKRFECASNFLGEGEPAPAPGDCTLCIKCGSFLTFEEDLQLRLTTLDEVGSWPDEMRIKMLQAREAIVGRVAGPPPVWTIYDHPRDLPQHVVARRWRGLKADGPAHTFATIDAARAFVQAQPGVDFCLGRASSDDPVIVESWI